MRMSKVDECLLDIRRNTERILAEHGSVGNCSMVSGSFSVRTYTGASARLQENIERRSWLVSSPCSSCGPERKRDIVEKLAFDRACFVFCENSRLLQKEHDASFRAELAAIKAGDCREVGL